MENYALSTGVLPLGKAMQRNRKQGQALRLPTVACMKFEIRKH